MTSDSEDDSLNWEGDDSLEARRPGPRRRVKAPEGVAAPKGVVPDAQTADAAALDPSVASAALPASAAVVADEAEDQPQGIGTVSLLLFGILGGIYLLYTVGWVIGGLGMQARAMFMLPAPLYLASMWLAVLAPALWFASVLVLTRRSKNWIRVVGLIVGTLLLVPWPFVVAGGGGML